MIVKFSDLAILRKRFHNKKIVFAGGSFDLFHRGHIESIKNLRKYGDIVFVAVSTDKRIKQRKGSRRPIMSERDRVALIDAIRYTDYSLVAPEPKKNGPVPTMQILSALRPDAFVTIDKKWLEYKKMVEDFGVRLYIVPRGNLNSTTRIIDRILRKYGAVRLMR